MRQKHNPRHWQLWIREVKNGKIRTIYKIYGFCPSYQPPIDMTVTRIGTYPALKKTVVFVRRIL